MRRGTRRGRLAVVLGVVCVLGLAVSLQTAGAHRVSFDSSVKLKLAKLDVTTTQFSGEVTSVRAACEVGRTVTITVNGAVIATATSVVGGAWSATAPAPAKGSTVIATVQRKWLKRNKKHRHKCRPASAQRRAN